MKPENLYCSVVVEKHAVGPNTDSEVVRDAKRIHRAQSAKIVAKEESPKETSYRIQLFNRKAK